MITDDILFVTGAGCSIPFGMPSTAELSADIRANTAARLTKGVVHPQLGMLRNVFERFRNEFINAQCDSIDQFLFHRPDWAKVGKQALAASLHYFTKPASVQYGNGDWLRYLSVRMTEDCRSGPEGYEDFKTNKVAFVTFNYDLLIEQFFELKIKSLFKQAGKPDLPFPIKHVYGHLTPDLYGISSASRMDLDLINQSADLIKVIGEEERKAGEVDEDIVNLFKNAKQIIVMGFGWDPTNMRMLPWGVCEHRPHIVMGTKGVAPPIERRASKTLSKFKNLGGRGTQSGTALEIIRDRVDLQTIARSVSTSIKLSDSEIQKLLD